MEEKLQVVNEALCFPLGDEFERVITEHMDAHPEGDADLVIAVIDLDNFLHINQDFGRVAGDEMLISTGRFLAA